MRILFNVLLTKINISKDGLFYEAESALRDRDSAHIVKLKTSTSCRAFHH